MSTNNNELKQNNFPSIFLIGLSILTGAAAAYFSLFSWIPGIVNSLSAENVTAYWYLSRESAFVAFILLWISMMLGVGITNKLASIWPGLPSTIELHQYTSILGLLFGLFHALILLGDRYIGFKFLQILIPFTSYTFQPFLVGIGQIVFYLWAIIVFSFYIRKKIGRKTWRIIHFLSFLTFIMALYHGINIGTDAQSIWAQSIYLTSGVSLLFMTIYRILKTIMNKPSKPEIRITPPPINHQ